MTTNSCRICLEDESINNILISPCLCKGSMKFIHRTCLDMWRKSNTKAYYECDICKYKYKFYRNKIANLLRNKFIIILLTLFTYLIITLIIGFMISNNNLPYKNNIISYLLYGNIVMGMFGFITMLLSTFNGTIHNPFFHRNNSPGDNKMFGIIMIIIIIIGIIYIFYYTYIFVKMGVEYYLGKIEDMIENIC